MPIELKDIIVSVDKDEEETEWEDGTRDAYCIVCGTILERTEDYKYEAIPHTLDICLKVISIRVGLRKTN